MGTPWRQSMLVWRIGESPNGLVVWLALRWYCVDSSFLLGRNCSSRCEEARSLARNFRHHGWRPDGSRGRVPLVYALSKAIIELNRADVFKTLPGHERRFVPRSSIYSSFFNRN